MNRYIVIFFFMISFSSSAQEMWGISNSNYSGNMGIFLNPSTIVNAPYKYEAFAIGADLFVQNTYIYFPQQTNYIWKSLSNTVTGKVDYAKRDRDLFTGDKQFGNGHLLLIGPSYINSNADDMAWGFHTAYRAEVSARDVSPAISKYIYDVYSYAPFNNQSYSDAPFSAAVLNFAELGGTYGRVYLDNAVNYIKWAATVNFLLGFNGVYFDVKKADYTILDPHSAIIHSMDATVGESMRLDKFGSLFSIRGIGASTTLGGTYIHNRKKSDCNAEGKRKYDYRIGASLMDFGFVHFFKGKSQIVTAQTSTDRLLTNLDSVHFSMNNMNGVLTDGISSSPATSIQKKAINMYVPTAFSFQFDYSITPTWYANASIVNRFVYSVKEVTRPDQIDISIRYEKRKWEANLNYSIYEYKDKDVGFGVRYKWLVLGSDRLIELLNLRDTKTFDFFFGIKWTSCDFPFKKAKSCPAYGPQKIR